MSSKKLFEIAEVLTGLVLSRKEAKFEQKNTFKYKKLNLRAIGENGNIDLTAFDEYFSIEPIEEQFITKEKDIVMRLFEPLSPAIITSECEGLIVPSQLAIIRVKSQHFLSEYIYHFLSQKNTLRFLSQQDIGTAARGIRISTLSEVEIPLLPLDKQKSVTHLGETHQKRKQLYLELIDQYDIQAANIISKVIGGK